MSASEAPPPDPNREPTADERRRVSLGVGAVSSAKTVGGVLNVLTLVVLTRLLGKHDFAVVVLAYIVQDTITAIGPLGLPSAMSFHLPRLGPSVARALGLQTALILLALSAPFALGLGLGGHWIADRIDLPDAGWPLVLVGLAVVADFPGRAWPDYLVAREAWRPAFWVTLLYYVSRFASLVLPAALGANPDVIVLWLTIAAVARGIGFFVHLLVFEEGELGPAVRRQWTVGSLFAYGVPLSITQIVGKLNVQVDKYMVVALMSAETFAAYSVGAVELPLVPGIAYATTIALIPVLVRTAQRGDTADFLSYWHGSMVKVAALMMPTAIGLFVLAEPTVRVLFSSDYSEAAAPFRVYLGLLPLRLCAYGAVLRALGTTRPIMVSSVVGLVVNLGLNYPLLLWLGMTGPAYASVVAQVVGIVIMLQAARAQLGIGWRAVFPLRAVLVTAGVALLAAPALVAVLFAVDGDVPRLVVGSVVYITAYVLLARLTGVITRDDLDYAMRFLTLRLLEKDRR
ncbi:MAG: polysaccharide biosynthesis protein [Myxococcales bacterium]|nr:polysaccharide biosynthesis protein [Myxococcales bacterium]